MHPKYQNGEWDEARVFMEFLKSFEPDESKRDGKVRFSVSLSNFVDPGPHRKLWGGVMHVRDANQASQVSPASILLP